MRFLPLRDQSAMLLIHIGSHLFDLLKSRFPLKVKTTFLF